MSVLDPVRTKNGYVVTYVSKIFGNVNVERNGIHFLITLEKFVATLNLVTMQQIQVLELSARMESFNPKINFVMESARQV